MDNQAYINLHIWSKPCGCTRQEVWLVKDNERKLSIPKNFRALSLHLTEKRTAWKRAKVKGISKNYWAASIVSNVHFNQILKPLRGFDNATDWRSNPSASCRLVGDSVTVECIGCPERALLLPTVCQYAAHNTRRANQWWCQCLRYGSQSSWEGLSNSTHQTQRQNTLWEQLFAWKENGKQPSNWNRRVWGGPLPR